MCGIAGFIGKSKNPKVSFELIHEIFSILEVRGTDASGVWATQKGNDGKIIYHKEPLKSSEFVKKKVWSNISKIDTDLMVIHARAATPGVGKPADNKNNHPFTSSCRTIGLVHNGKVPEATHLKEKYERFSTCDSEILLRIFENKQGKLELSADKKFPEWTENRLAGIADIWSQADTAHMAVGIGERHDNGDRSLWVFRNHHRPLWMFDLREELGQIFFCSTQTIFQNAAATINEFYQKSVKMHEVPTEEVWMFHMDKDGIDRHRFEVKSKSREAWKHEGNQIPIAKKPKASEIYTKLDDKDNVVHNKASKDDSDKETVSASDGPESDGPTSDSPADKKSKLFDRPANSSTSTIMDDMPSSVDDCSDAVTCAAAINGTLEQLMVEVENKVTESSMPFQAYQDMLESLEQYKLDLEATLAILKSY